MKTTVDISDELLREARRMAHEEGTTLKSLIEEGLRAVLARREEGRRYVLPDASVGGEGLQPEAQGASWAELRAMAYGDRL
ncbi:MAG: type II toxin-antitoxin system VapB family antitoxin [Actinoallomurus sp.]